VPGALMRRVGDREGAGWVEEVVHECEEMLE